MKKILTILLLMFSSGLFSQEITEEITLYNKTFGYYENCKVLKKDKSKLHGPYERNVLNKVAITGQYDHNNKIGEWKFFNYDGNINYSYDYSKKEFITVNASCENQLVIIGKDTLMLKVDRPVLFEGSNMEIMNYLMMNLTYPVQAAEKAIKGRVFVGLVINESGELENSYIIRGLEKSLNKEALRVFSKFKGNWFPAVLDGQKVKSVFIYPVAFNSI